MPVFNNITLCRLRHEGALLYKDIRIDTVTYTIAKVITIIKAVGHMHFSKADTRTTLRTAISPPTADERTVEMTCIYVGCIVAVTYQIAVTVIIAAATASSFRCYKVTEAGPTDTDAVRSFDNVEIAINTILDVTVVHPHILSTNQTDVITIVGINVVGARTE